MSRQTSSALFSRAQCWVTNDREQNEQIEDDDETTKEPVQKVLEQVEPALRQLILFTLLFLLHDAFPYQFISSGEEAKVVQCKSLIQRHVDCG